MRIVEEIKRALMILGMSLGADLTTLAYPEQAVASYSHHKNVFNSNEKYFHHHNGWFVLSFLRKKCQHSFIKTRKWFLQLWEFISTYCTINKQLNGLVYCIRISNLPQLHLLVSEMQIDELF